MNMHPCGLFFCLQRFYSGFRRGQTPLHLSSNRGHLDVCQFLVEKGANVNATEDKYATLHYAYEYKDALLGFVFLQRFYSAIFSGSTPLHCSIAAGHLGVCQFLVDKEADVEATYDKYATLPCACAHEHAPMRFVWFATFLFWNFQWNHPVAFVFCTRPLGRLPVSRRNSRKKGRTRECYNPRVRHPALRIRT
jgi:hypothetical protein